ncbi:hypothetical protein ABPG75_007165 [Micractinium tetrahymenae]
MESPGVVGEEDGLLLPLFAELPPAAARKGPKQKGLCVLCNTIKSTSWRKHALVDGTICNRCYCRTVRLVKQQQAAVGPAAGGMVAPQAWDADFSAAGGSAAAGALALRQLANEPPPPAKRHKQSDPQHPAGAVDDGPMVRPRRQHSGFAAYADEQPAAAADFPHAPAHPGAYAAGQQHSAAPLAAFGPALRSPGASGLSPAGGFSPAGYGQHAAPEGQGGNGAAGAGSLLQSLLGALLQAGWGKMGPQLPLLCGGLGQGPNSAWPSHAHQPASQQPSLQQLLAQHPSLLALLGQPSLPGRQPASQTVQVAQAQVPQAQAPAQQPQGPSALLQRPYPAAQQPEAQPAQQTQQQQAQQARQRPQARCFTPLHQQLPPEAHEVALAVTDAALAPAPPAAAEDAQPAEQLLLEQLQEECWGAAEDLQEVTRSASLAWERCRRQLPGAQALPLAVLPAARLALPSGSGVLHPAGVLLARALVPVREIAAAGLGAEASPQARADLAAAVAALTPDGLAPALRIVVYGTAGVLLECWDGLPADAAGRLGSHPLVQQPCWVAGDEWALVFPASKAGEPSRQLGLFKAMLAVPTQQLAALQAIEPDGADDAPSPASTRGPGLLQAFPQRLRQAQRQLQAGLATMAEALGKPPPTAPVAAPPELPLSLKDSPLAQAPAAPQQLAASGHADGGAGTGPPCSTSGQPGACSGLGSGSQQAGQTPAGSHHSLGGSGSPAASDSDSGVASGDVQASGSTQSGDTQDPSRSASLLAGSENASGQQEQEREQQLKAEPEQLTLEQQHFEALQPLQDRQAAQPAQPPPAPAQQQAGPPGAQPPEPLRSAFLDARPSVPPQPGNPSSLHEASREVEMLAAAAKALSAASGPPSGSAAGSHGSGADGGVQAAVEPGAAGNLQPGLHSLGSLSFLNLNGPTTHRQPPGLASVPGLLDRLLSSLLNGTSAGHAQVQ